MEDGCKKVVKLKRGKIKPIPENVDIYHKQFEIYKSLYQDLKEDFSLELFNLDINLKDTWDFAPVVEVNPKLTSTDMVEPVVITSEKTDDGKYSFTNLYSGSYTLNMGYKSFKLEKDVEIPQTKSLSLEFPAEYDLNLNVMSSYGEKISEGEIATQTSYSPSQAYQCACDCSCVCDCACFCSCFDFAGQESNLEKESLTKELIFGN